MKTNNRLNVLIVEDEPLISIFIKRIVLDMGENMIGICYNSEDAIEMIKSKKPDLIFMDINIQGSLDGISVIRKVPMPHNPTIFFVSAYSDSDTINDALSTNPYNYLIKPISGEDIKIAITLARQNQKKILTEEKKYIVLNDEIYYDLVKKELFINEKSIILSTIDNKIISMFINNINTTLSLDEIKVKVWGEKKISPTTIRDAISKLRKKIPKLNIETNFGRGYILTA